MFVQIVEDNLESLLHSGLGRQGKGLDLANGMSEAWALLSQFSQLLGGDVSINCSIEVEEAARYLN